MIRLNNAVVEYNNFKLGELNIRLDLGEFISVVGPSGSGKSTLIRIITGYSSLISGSIEYIECSKDDIMYISQIGTTFNHLNVRDNLKLKYDYSEEEIVKCLNQVGLNSEFIEKYPFQLSGGERQRIDLTRALLSKSKYIVLDESMSALDSANKESISKILKELVNSSNISIIYVTHDVAQALEYSSRIISLENGQITFDNSKDKYSQLKAGDEDAGDNNTKY